MKICRPYKDAKLFHISQGFGGFHTAADFAYKYGTFLVSPENCVVEGMVCAEKISGSFDDLERGYGIRLKSSSTRDTLYLHWHCLPVFPVKVGDIVLQGQIVAQMGNSGSVRIGDRWILVEERLKPPYPATHDHFQMILEGVPVDPLKYIDWTIPVKYGLIDELKASLNITLKVLGLLKK